MRRLLCLCCLAIAVPVVAAEPIPDELAAEAGRILERNCLQCHRGSGSASKAKFDVRDVNSMIEYGVIVKGAPKDSLIRELAHRGTMPPRSQPQLSRLIGEDVEALEKWIQAGAPDFPAVKPRTPIALESTLRTIVADLRRISEPRLRSRQRYFSLVEAHNNPAVRSDTLKLTHAALAKALNSLSWEREIVLPREVKDSGGTLFAIDIEQLGWSSEHWRAIRDRYPYAVGYTNLQERILEDLDREIQHLAERREPVYLVRADWFVATALQPSLYHAVLYDLTLPDLQRRLVDKSQPANPKQMTAIDLEKFLDIDVVANIERGEERAMRSGFTPSGVSGQNRLLERHRTKHGAYWKSYDFKANNRKAILSQFPLGPNYPGNQNSRLAFDHDGGEVIFNLPNGLQAYLLIDGKDRRIDAGPIEVVSDALKTSGTPAIINGLSCMSCHKEGMIDPPADEIRDFARLFGTARDHVQRLYSPRELFDKKVNGDAAMFQAALQKTIGPILKQGADSGRELREFPEPVSDVARNFLQEELDLVAVAAELNEPNTERLKAKLSENELLQRLGLAVLLRKDGKIKRLFWEGTVGGMSVMQLAATTLDYSATQRGD